MPAHKFILGQKVAFQPEFGQSANRGEVFTVIRQLPEANGALQYQVKSQRRPHPYGTGKADRRFIGPAVTKSGRGSEAQKPKRRPTSG
jgi:hypothetical protein